MAGISQHSMRPVGLGYQGRPEYEWLAMVKASSPLTDRVAVQREYGVGETVFSMGEPNRGVHCMIRGAVAIRKYDANGHGVVLRLAYPGDTFGYRSFLLDEDHQTTAEAVEETRTCFIDRNTLRAVLDSDPALAKTFLRFALSELDHAHETVIRMASLSNRTRLIHLLRLLLRRHGKTREDGSAEIHLPLSREDIATMIGAGYETVSRIIGRLEKDGVADFSGRSVVIPDVAVLIDETGDD